MFIRFLVSIFCVEVSIYELISVRARKSQSKRTLDLVQTMSLQDNFIEETKLVSSILTKGDGTQGNQPNAF